MKNQFIKKRSLINEKYIFEFEEKNMIEKILKEKNKIFIAITLIIIGVFSRIALINFLPNTPHIYLNLNGISQPLFMLDLFFIVAVIAIISGLVLGSYYTFLIPIAVMVISDVLIGNTYIFLFTWSGFAILGLIGYMLKTKRSMKLRNMPMFLGTGILGILLYDFWTNLGCWLGWYPHTLNGFIICFTVAIPFTLWHLLSTTAMLTAVLIPIIILKNHKIIKLDVSTNPFEKYATLAVPAVLIILAVISLIV